MSDRIALVTGGNRGIGLEICRQLGHQGMRVILSARNAVKGEAAALSLRHEGLEVHFHPLDVTSPRSLDAIVASIEEDFGRLDVLINNAGVLLDPAPGGAASSVFKADLDTIRASLETNLYGPLSLCQRFVPMMCAHGYGRVVNLSSGMGQLSAMNGGYPAYRLSKTGLNALTRIVADEVQNYNVLVNSMCPGWVRTDMGGPDATRDVPEGADTAVWLATLPDDGPSGGFFRDRQVIPW